MGKLTCLPQGLLKTKGKLVQNLGTSPLERNETSWPSSRSRRGGREGFSPLHWPEQGEGSIPRVLVDPLKVGLIHFVLGTHGVHFHLGGPPSVAETLKRLSSSTFSCRLWCLTWMWVRGEVWEEQRDSRNTLRTIKHPLKSSVVNHQ